MRVIRNFLQRCYESKQVAEIMDWIRRETYGKPYSSFMIGMDVKTPEDSQLRLNVIPSPEHGPTQIFSFPPPTPKWTYKNKVHCNHSPCVTKRGLRRFCENIVTFWNVLPRSRPGHSHCRDCPSTSPARGTPKRQNRMRSCADRPHKRDPSKHDWKSSRYSMLH